MKTYVAGLLFDKARQQVALVKKNRPQWQSGKWNAIGGKVEPGETTPDAMVREFREETGVSTSLGDWKLVVSLSDPELDWLVHFFVAFSDDVRNVRTITDEEIALFPIASIPNELIPKLAWIIPLSLSTDVELPVKIKHIGECS